MRASFRRMTDGYFAAFDRSEPEAVAAMINFYGDAGTFASWPARLRDYRSAARRLPACAPRRIGHR